MKKKETSVWVGGEWWDTSPITNVQVPEGVNYKTGLLDKNGNPYYRQPNPVGFHLVK